VQLSINGGVPEARRAQALGSWAYFGSAALPKGEHVVDILSSKPVGRVLIANIPLSDAHYVDMAWCNRAGQVTFEQERVDYTMADLRLLRRHGFIMHQLKDSQCMAEAVENGIRLTPFRSLNPCRYIAGVADGVRHDIAGGFDPGLEELFIPR